MNPFLTGSYASLEKWEYPIALDGGLYNGTLYGMPMSMNSWALYYNKSMMKAAGITSPPTTLAQLYTDQAKEWKISGSKLEQIGFYPLYNQGFEYFGSFFGAVNCFELERASTSWRAARARRTEANFFAQYDKYPYSSVAATETAYGAVAGGDDDAFVAGKEGFAMDGPWEGAQNIPDTNPKHGRQLRGGAVPGHGRRPEHVRPGQLQHHPQGRGQPEGRVHVHHLAGWLPQPGVQLQHGPQGRLDTGLTPGRGRARLPDVDQGQPVAEGIRQPDVQ